jgi:hypothetical protein
MNLDNVMIGRPYFSNDMGGFAVIAAGDDHVDVTFDQPYAEEPVINASLNFDGDGVTEWQNIRYAVTHKSNTGFTIQLYQANGGQEVKFSWMALAIKNARTAHSNGGSVSTSTTGGGSTSGSGTGSGSGSGPTPAVCGTHQHNDPADATQCVADPATVCAAPQVNDPADLYAPCIDPAI